MSTATQSARIVSMDQFRGYTVVGMFLVNFLGWFALTHQFFRHNNTHFSYADSIMPSFIFCAGFSYRLTAVKRFREMGTWGAVQSYIQRSLVLILISVLLDTPDPKFGTWSQVTTAGVREFLFKIVKSGLWEVLAIIGVCQILLLPVINRGPLARFVAAILLGLGHFAATFAFNYNFQLGRDNWFNSFWGAPTSTTWDGGMFGILAWSVTMLAGTLTYDLMKAVPPKRSWRVLMACSVLLMGTGYLFSCMTRLYDRVPGEWDRLVAESQGANGKKVDEHAPDPVWPQAGRWTSPGIGWAEPPFVPPPSIEKRSKNFWMMNKKFVTPAFNLFSIGFALAVYAVFIVACDVGRWESHLLRTFGQNPLAAYVAHQATKHSVRLISPKDSPLPWVIISFLIFFTLTWLIIRYMEKQKLYVRL